jgi:DNA-binding winged helix-turn-helix (wHTH) protein
VGEIKTEYSGEGTRFHNVAVRLADEGVPIAAICRATRVPQREVRDVLAEALQLGRILSIPRDDWPAGTRREERVPDAIPLTLARDDICIAAQRTFRLTQTQSILFTVLMRRPQVMRQALHACIQRPERSEQTDMKNLDVQIYHMRRKLGRHGIDIITLWGSGYYIAPESKRKAVELMLANLPPDVPPEELVSVDSPPIVPVQDNGRAV